MKIRSLLFSRFSHDYKREKKCKIVYVKLGNFPFHITRNSTSIPKRVEGDSETLEGL